MTGQISTWTSQNSHVLRISLTAKIDPSYDPAVTVERTFTVFSKYYLQETGDLDLLGRVRTLRVSWPQYLPSWVLDLDSDEDFVDMARRKSKRDSCAANLGMPKANLLFLRNDQLLACRGVVLDTIHSLAGAEAWSPTLRNAVKFPTQDGKRNLSPTHDQDWRLSLARVLMHDSHFEFTERPSILDVPWIAKDHISHEVGHEVHELSSLALRFGYSRGEAIPWSRYLKLSVFSSFFLSSMCGNEDFEVGGLPLKHYFPSADEWCSDARAFSEIGDELGDGFFGQRLFTSQSGRLVRHHCWRMSVTRLPFFPTVRHRCSFAAVENITKSLDRASLKD